MQRLVRDNRLARLVALLTLASTAPCALAVDADVWVGISDPLDYFAPGFTTRYQASIYNRSPVDLTGIVVRGTTPPALSCTWACDQNQGIACEDEGSGNLDHVVNLGAYQRVHYNLWCTVAHGTTGEIDATLAIEPPAGVVNTGPTGNSRFDRNSISAPADLRVTINDTTGIAPIGSGYLVRYLIRATNDGPTRVDQAHVLGLFPTSCSWRCYAEGPAVCPPSYGSPYIWVSEFVDLGPGSSVVYDVSCMTPASLTKNLLATAAIGGHRNDPDLNNNSAETQAPIISASSTDLIVDIDDGDGKVKYNETVDYVVRARNAGTAASDAQVMITRSAYLERPSWTCETLDGATCGNATYDSSTLVHDVNLPPGATAIIRYTATYTGRADSGNVGERVTQGARILNVGTNETNIADNRAVANTRVSLFYSAFD